MIVSYNTILVLPYSFSICRYVYVTIVSFMYFIYVVDTIIAFQYLSIRLYYDYIVYVTINTLLLWLYHSGMFSYVIDSIVSFQYPSIRLYRLCSFYTLLPVTEPRSGWAAESFKFFAKTLDRSYRDRYTLMLDDMDVVLHPYSAITRSGLPRAL